jgi:hypothetical protein
MCPDLKYLEVVAFVQAKWETLCLDERIKYEIKLLQTIDDLESKEN